MSIDIKYKPELPKTKQPIIIIGAGGIVADAHLPAYKIAGFEVYGIVNRTKERAQKLADKFGIPHVFDSLAEAVNQAPANVVYDLTIMPEQYLATLKQLPEGSAVLIQKPMGDDFKQANEILALCREKGFKAAINFQFALCTIYSCCKIPHRPGFNWRVIRYGSTGNHKNTMGNLSARNYSSEVGDPIPQHSLCGFGSFILRRTEEHFSKNIKTSG